MFGEKKIDQADEIILSQFHPSCLFCRRWGFKLAVGRQLIGEEDKDDADRTLVQSSLVTNAIGFVDGT